MTMRSRNSPPATGTPCIWMQAGVIDYWLCDRSFDCELCPLDRALRGRFADRPQRVPPDPAPRPETMRYHPSHLWINPMGGTEWTLGLDRCALHAFSEPVTVSLPRAGRRIAREAHLLSLLIGGDALRWPSPLDVIVLERNDRWDEHPEQLCALPEGDSWLLLVKLSDNPDLSGWRDASGMEALCDQERSALKELCLAATSPRDGIGETAADGGVLSRPPDRILTRKSFLAFLRGRWGLMTAGAGF